MSPEWEILYDGVAQLGMQALMAEDVVVEFAERYAHEHGRCPDGIIRVHCVEDEEGWSAWRVTPRMTYDAWVVDEET